MTAGITVFNDWGTVQIDENWAAMSLRHKTQIAVQTPATGAQAFNGSITFAATSPMVFWKADAPIYALTSTNNGNGTWTYTFRASDPTFATVYVFDTPEWATQNYGLEIFNAFGVKVFGDQLSPLKLAKVIPIGAVPLVWAGLPLGDYAVTTSDPGFRSETYAADIERTAVFSCGARHLGNGASCDWVLARDSIPFAVNSQSFTPKFLVIADVAGL
ncbi:hypothetical protein [Cupriavidus sp. H39]|uniref:hypothetical protein n=1 Tax=Cupriavidus sp. H39 TaxID=3401635 RepID=UPI003D065F20